MDINEEGETTNEKLSNNKFKMASLFKQRV